jgi:hypothetical protein
MTTDQILIYSGGGREVASPGAGLHNSNKPTDNALLFLPSMCPDSKRPTLGIPPPPPPLKNSTWPQHKRITRVEKNFPPLTLLQLPNHPHNLQITP